MSKGSKKSWYHHEGRGPMVRKASLDQEWEDPTFDAVADPDLGEIAADLAALKADILIRKLAETAQEQRFLDALAVGHHLAEARRLAGMTERIAEKFLERCLEKIVRDGT